MNSSLLDPSKIHALSSRQCTETHHQVCVEVTIFEDCDESLDITEFSLWITDSRESCKFVN